MKITMLGLGRMGRELAAHVVDAGHELTVWNRSADARQTLMDRGARPADSAAEAVDGAELVLSVLFGPETVREVIVEADLPIPGGATWVDITTVSPADTHEFDAWATAHGIHYAHSPVVGSLAPARAGELGVLLGGSSEAVDVAREIVSLWAAPERLHEYDSAQEAAAGKLVANLALAISLQGVAEALQLGRAGGLDTEAVLARLLDKSMFAPIVTAKGDAIRSGSFDDAQFTVDALIKDLRLMGEVTGGSTPALDAAGASLAAAADRGLGDHDISVIASVEGPPA